VDPTLGSPQRFLREASIGQRIDARGLVRVERLLSLGDCCGILTAYVEGAPLSHIIAARQHPESFRLDHSWVRLDSRSHVQAVLTSVETLLEALARVHTDGICHRDIKPSNILVDRKGLLWLTDFGLARFEQETLGTQRFGVLGTPGYMSPEQELGRRVDGRSDLFSLGITIYEALTLRNPYGKGAHRLFDQRYLPLPPSRLEPAVPRAFDPILLKLLERDPAKRYQDASELLADWRRALRGQRPAAHSYYRHVRLVRIAQGSARTALLALLLVELLLGFARLVREPTTQARSASPTLVRARIETNPPGARITLVPLKECFDGFLRSRIFRPAQTTPLVVEGLPEGAYLIVATLPDGRFHEVYRSVYPQPEGQLPEGTAGYFSPALDLQFPRHRRRVERDGTIVLPRIDMRGHHALSFALGSHEPV
jgi:serine/threonine protein kinase